MLCLKCTKIKRDKNNKIIEYLLIDNKGAARVIKKDKLKAMIKSGKVQVTNLTLTADNRLVIKGSLQETGLHSVPVQGSSLREIVLQCGESGYQHKGLVYWLLRDKTVAVKAIDKNIENAFILKGTEVIHGSAFWGCSCLTDIELPEGVIGLGNDAFKSCKSLKTIELPKSVSHIGLGAFRGCSSLVNINIPEGVEFIGTETFVCCRSLNNIKLPSRFKGQEKTLGLTESTKIEYY